MRSDPPTDSERWRKVEDLLDVVLELPAGERRAFLDNVCDGDLELRARLEALLTADEEAGGFLATPIRDVTDLLAGTSRGESLVGREIGPYRLVREIGSGGMGVVYEAEDARLRRRVAIKLLPAELSRDPAAKERFLREARAASALDDPNICTVHDIGESDGRLYIVMAFYEGETLKERLQRGPLPIAEARQIAIQVARALVRAHGTGIVHRDIKPANVIISHRGEVKILDFGIAKMKGDASLTRTGDSPGTPAYMSPEQARGEPVDGRTDLWALGALLYEMLAGQRPFPADDDKAVLFSILNRDPEPLDRIRPEVPPALAWIVARALAKNLKDRYQTAAELVADLESGRTPSVQRPLRRNAVLAAVLLGIGVVVATVWWAVRWNGGLRTVSRPSAAGQMVPTVGVIAFANRTGKPELDWYGGAIARLVMDSLSTSRHLRVASEQRTASLVGIESPAKLARRAAAGGIDVFLTGEILPAAQGLRVAARLQDTRRGRLLAAFRRDGLSPDRLLLAADDIAPSVRKGLGVPPTEEVGGLAADFLARNPEAYGDYVRGLSAFLRFRYREAEPSFVEALRKAPDFTMARYRLALLQYVTSRTDEALTNIQQAAAEVGRLPDREARYVRAGEALFSRRTDEAVSGYRQLVKLYPYETEARYFLAQALISQSRYEEALSALAVLKRLDSDNPLAWTMAGESNLALRRFDQALTDLRKALDRDPTDIYARYMLGKAYKALGELDLAVEELSETLRLKPDHHFATLALAEIDFLRQREDEAMRRLLSLASNSDALPRHRVTAALDLAWLYRAQGRFQAADQILAALGRQIAAEKVREPTALTLRGLSRLELGGIAGARRFLDAAVLRSAGHRGRRVCALCARGLLELRQEKWDALEETARQLRSASPSPSDPDRSEEKAASYLLGLRWLAADRPDSAVDELSRAVALKGNECALYRLGLARAYLAGRRFPEALAAAREAANERDPAEPRLDLELDRVRALLVVARVQEALGRLREAAASARQFLQRWARADPRVPDLAEARRLAGLDGRGRFAYPTNPTKR